MTQIRHPVAIDALGVGYFETELQGRIEIRIMTQIRSKFSGKKDPDSFPTLLYSFDFLDLNTARNYIISFAKPLKKLLLNAYKNSVFFRWRKILVISSIHNRKDGFI